MHSCFRAQRASLRPALIASVSQFRTTSPVACHAKKKGGKKGGKKAKGSLLGDLAKKPSIQPWQTTEVIMQHLLMVESYRRAAGKPFMESVEIETIADTLYEAPFVILAHNRCAKGVEDKDAVFTYANKAALEAFQAESFEHLKGQLSQVTVAGLGEEEAQAREAFLDSPAQADTIDGATKQAGEIDPGDEAAGEAEGEEEQDMLQRRKLVGENARIVHGSGWRVGLKGRKIYVDDVQLWNILSPTGETVGQAVRFPEYKLEDGTVLKIGSGGIVVTPPTEGDAEAAAAAVTEQAAVVRALKEEGGKSNSDPEVQEAVAELLKRKSELAALQEALEAAAEDVQPVA